ncbi:MAG: sulfotransferase [Spiribacter sp.]|nr:sulfotransferase [Spiribacter sp.]MDR9454372.1 sulfotransferase [Spiribacter sp.]
MLKTLADTLGLIISGLVPRREDLLRPTPRRVLVSLLAAVLLPPALLYYWIGLWLDELCFRRYRQIKVRQPVFILGVPRSGTTALHEALAEDSQFTTQRTWECLLAPAISHRYAWRALARIDRGLGSPMQRLAGWLNQRILSPLTQAHPVSARAPEEDYLSLLPHLSAFILIVAFPNARRLWRLGRGDEALGDSARQRLMGQYRRAIQRHLYVHGTERTYLAKNASHAVLAGSLAEAFPDARFIACLREPQKVVSSQIASMTPALNALHGPINQWAFNRRMRQQLHFAYANLLAVLPAQAPQRAVFLPLNAQRTDLAGAVRRFYQQFDLTLSPEYAERLKQRARQAGAHRSGHQHQLADHGLSPALIRAEFADLTARFDCAGDQPIAAADVTPYRHARRVVVVSDAAAERNGVGAYYSDLIDHLDDRVAAINLIAPGKAPRGHRIPHWREAALPGDATQSLALPSPWALYQAMADAAPQVIIVATPGPYGLLAAHMAHRIGAKLIFGLHTDYEALAGLYWGSIRSRLNRWGMTAVNRALFRRADVVVSNSAHMHALAQQKGAQRAVRVNTPIPKAFVDEPTATPSLPPQRVLFVGRLAAEKRVQSVIEAAEALPELHFTLAGDGPLRAEVEAATQRLDNLEALGWVARPALRQVLDDADLLVLPSEVEAFGTVALEAMVRGRLALVSPGCGIADWPELANGLIVMDDGESVAGALTRLSAERPATLAARAAAGQAAARSMATRCIDEWTTLIENTRPSQPTRDQAARKPARWALPRI